MIKEKLMEALKVAADEYNSGMSANAAVAKAAEDADFNDHQSERLVEMFNTLATLNKEKDANDATGSCELASKSAVAKLLLDRCAKKEASVMSILPSYDFYSGDPKKTNPTIESRSLGVYDIVKQAAANETIHSELDISQRSLYKVICEKINLVKSAGDAADDVARQLRVEIGRDALKIAKAIEAPGVPDEIADLFKMACEYKKAVAEVAEYSTKVAESNGGKYANQSVFNAEPVEELLKIAETIEKNISMIPEYEKKRDFYHTKAAEAQKEMMEIVGINTIEKKASIADFLNAGGVKIMKKPAAPAMDVNGELNNGNLSVKIAELIRKSGISSEEAEKLAQDLEKDAASMPGVMPVLSIPAGETIESMAKGRDIPEEKQILLNVRRSIILADLMSNDPIIRDADPNAVTEAYKTMIMTSPRVSLDKAQVRAFLRSAANSVAISPSDAKVIADVDRGVALSNVERLTNLDSSIKDSNKG